MISLCPPIFSKGRDLQHRGHSLRFRLHQNFSTKKEAYVPLNPNLQTGVPIP